MTLPRGLRAPLAQAPAGSVTSTPRPLSRTPSVPSFSAPVKRTVSPTGVAKRLKAVKQTVTPGGQRIKRALSAPRKITSRMPKGY